MRVCFLVQELSPSGGVNVIRAHARALADAGHDVELVVTGADSGAAAREEEWDWAITTWWETAAPAFGVRARRRLAFLQSFESLFYRDDEPFEREAAAAVLGLPFDFVVVGDWMRELLAELAPGARCETVRNGVDKELFHGSERAPAPGRPLRVLVEGEPGLWFKGVEAALDAVRLMREPVEVTLVTPLAPGEPPEGVERLLGGLAPGEMAEVYRESDVLLKLSRVEGLGLPPLEGFHTGLPCVVTPFGGQLDYLRHAGNGLAVGFDDPAGTAAALDLLARDRELLARLSRGALATARDWPDPASAGRAVADALARFDSLRPPEPGPGLERLLGSVRLTQESGRRLSGRLSWTEDALAEARALVHELSVSRDECAERLEAANDDLRRIRSTVPYRVAARAKALTRRGDPPGGDSPPGGRP